MKNISVSDLFLKKDHTGKRTPTALTWIILIAFIFSSYFLSQNKKPLNNKKTKQNIIKEKDIVDAATSHLDRDSFQLDFSDIGSPSNRNTSRSRRLNSDRTNSKMIVYDDTKDYRSDLVVPLGSMVKCLLIHNIVTNNFNAPVIAQVWEDFYFNGELLLPFGTRIYGTAYAGHQRDRIMVKFHSIVFQDGKTLKIDAIGLSKDGSGGLTGTIIDDSNKHMFWEMAINFLSGLALGFQKTTTNQLTGISQVESSSRNAILNGVANTFEKQADNMKADVEDAKGYAIVLAGNELVVYFEKEADTNPL